MSISRRWYVLFTANETSKRLSFVNDGSSGPLGGGSSTSISLNDLSAVQTSRTRSSKGQLCACLSQTSLSSRALLSAVRVEMEPRGRCVNRSSKINESVPELHYQFLARNTTRAEADVVLMVIESQTRLSASGTVHATISACARSPPINTL